LGRFGFFQGRISPIASAFRKGSVKDDSDFVMCLKPSTIIDSSSVTLGNVVLSKRIVSSRAGIR